MRLNKLTEQTAADLEAQFDVAALKSPKMRNWSNLPEAQKEFERSLFIKLLDRWAEHHVAPLEKLESRSEKARKRQLEKVSHAAAKLAAEINCLDLDSQVFLLQKFAEKEGDPERPLFQLLELHSIASASLMELLGTLRAASCEAAKTLPLTQVKVPLEFALSIERQFWERGFPYSLTETGFAADCLRAVLGTKDSVAGWLRKAKADPRSMHSFVKLMADRERDTPK